MLQSFQCPNCNAPLEYDGGPNYIVRCSHCNSSVVVPVDLRGARPGPRPGQTPAPKAEPLPPGVIGRRVFSFGGPGIGPGLFSDARSVTVDPSGYIYAADYTGGRVQKFTPEGEFMTLWMADPKMPLTGLAAEPGGTLLVAQKGFIIRYNGDTGEKVGQIHHPDGWGFQQAVVGADGSCVASFYNGRDDIVRFNPRGELVQTIPAALSGQTEDAELDLRVAVDGLGNIYGLGTFHNSVFKFNLSGRFVNRFGRDGDAPGQFRAPSAVAVDDQGRVFVADFKGVQAFDPDGRYLGAMAVRGPASGLAFEPGGRLWVAARTQIHQYEIGATS